MLLSIQISFYNLVGDKLDEKRKRFLSISQDQSSFYIRTERRGKYTDTDTVTGVVSQSHCLFKVWFNLSWYGSDLEGTGCAGAGCVAWRSWCHVPRLSQDWTGPQLVASLWPLACPRPACTAWSHSGQHPPTLTTPNTSPSGPCNPVLWCLPLILSRAECEYWWSLTESVRGLSLADRQLRSHQPDC